MKDIIRFCTCLFLSGQMVKTGTCTLPEWKGIRREEKIGYTSIEFDSIEVIVSIFLDIAENLTVFLAL